MILPITPRGFATPTLRSGDVSFTVEYQLFEHVDFGVAGASWVPEAGLIVLPWDTVRVGQDPEATVIRFARAPSSAPLLARRDLATGGGAGTTRRHRGTPAA